MAMTATVSSFTYLSVGDKPQPSSSAGLVRRDVIFKFAAGDASGNYSGGNTTGLGTIKGCSVIALGSSGQTFSLANTASTDGMSIYPITNGVTIVPSTTVGGCTAAATIISTS